MPFSARKLAKQAVQALIQPTIKNLKDVKEVNDQIIERYHRCAPWKAEGRGA